MTKTLTALLLILTCLVPSIALAETPTLPAIGQLSQMLGISNEEIQAELAAGKTQLQIAEEHGMRKAVYLKRVGGIHSKITTKSRTTRSRVAVKKPVKKVTAKITKAKQSKVPVKVVKKATSH